MGFNATWNMTIWLVIIHKNIAMANQKRRKGPAGEPLCRAL